MKEILKILFSKDKTLINNKANLCRSRCVVSVVLSVAAAFMLVMNIKNHSMTMAYLSIVLVVGFLLSALAAGILKNEKISAVIISVLVAFVLSAFAISGGNEGFAILWILLVPLFAINLLGVASGFLVSTYFLFFLFILFHTGANTLIADKYTSAFIARFPILYMSDYLIATFFSLQREYYHRSLMVQVYMDGLTGAYNRRYCMEQLKEIDNSNKDYAIIALDLNGLKKVNDNIGHEAGDEILCAVVDCCRTAFDKSDIICRTGGDEYIVIAYGDNHSIDQKVKKLKKCRDKWSGKLVNTLSFAIGCAYKEANVSYKDLMKKADQEMYSDKSAFYQDAKNNRRKTINTVYSCKNKKYCSHCNTFLFLYYLSFLSKAFLIQSALY